MSHEPHRHFAFRLIPTPPLSLPFPAVLLSSALPLPLASPINPISTNPYFSFHTFPAFSRQGRWMTCFTGQRHKVPAISRNLQRQPHSRRRSGQLPFPLGDATRLQCPPPPRCSHLPSQRTRRRCCSPFNCVSRTTRPRGSFGFSIAEF